jgi:hypothetical protein
VVRHGDGVTETAAYGLRFAGVPSTRWLGLHDVNGWPTLHVELRDADGPRLEPEIDVTAMTATLDGRADPGAIVHPLLAVLALRVVAERGMDALHAGAVAGADGAWAIVGAKEAGKSSLLAACATAGVDVITDDVLVFSGNRCLAGPRCIDLRPESAERFRVTETVRSAEPRKRLGLAPVRAEHPLAGIVFLEWGDGPALDPIAPSETLRRLLERHAVDRFPRVPVGLLDLAAGSAFVLRRPRDWSALDPTVELLRSELGLREGPEPPRDSPRP